MTFIRPKTLVELSRSVLAGETEFDIGLREFLDNFYSAAAPERERSMQSRPLSMDPLRDAYIAATAEHLARRWGLPVPPWTDDHGFELARPHFSGGLESLKAILTAESPTAFRRRLLFVSANALDRASMAHAP
ncbi:MAG: hypothetical protein HY060_18595 [Proteobacteria bacterium]|nr:hypothetical protein [Pseudomonadota bacterium]